MKSDVTEVDLQNGLLYHDPPDDRFVDYYQQFGRAVRLRSPDSVWYNGTQHWTRVITVTGRCMVQDGVPVLGRTWGVTLRIVLAELAEIRVKLGCDSLPLIYWGPSLACRRVIYDAINLRHVRCFDDFCQGRLVGSNTHGPGRRWGSTQCLGVIRARGMNYCSQFYPWYIASLGNLAPGDRKMSAAC